MALYSQADFSKMCGVSRAYVAMYIKRGKLIMSGDYIDDGIQQNFEMKQKWLAKKADKDGQPAPKEDKPKKQPKKYKVAKPKIKPKSSPVPNVQPPDYGSGGSEDSLDRKKTLADIELKEARIRILHLDEAKLRGENIPTDMVKNVVSILGQTFQSAYKNGAYQILLDMAHELKMSSKHEAKYKGKLIDLINQSHKNAIKEAKLGIKNIVEQIAVESDE